MRKHLHDNRERIEGFLSDLIRLESLPGREENAMDFLASEFGKMDVEVRKVWLDNSLKADPEYSSPIKGLEYDGRCNLRICKKGSCTNGKSLIFNAHVDVTPPSPDMPEPFSGRIKDGVIYGRGACDTKGSIASLMAALLLLEESDIVLDGDIIFHLVVEEENGGNGTLAMIREGEKAGGCIVMEPTELNLMTAIRGAVWFYLEFFGKAGHSGQAGRTKSALLMAQEAIDILSRYHGKLLERSRDIPLFGHYDNPMPITFGHMESGNWPASVPDHALLEGVLGFLPNKKREKICREMEDNLLSGQLIERENMALNFTYRHDCSIISPNHQLVEALLNAAQRRNSSSRADAMPASCDAWLYNNIAGIPTVVFGPGSLRYAHSNREQIEFQQVDTAARILFDFVNDFCGK